MQTQSEIYFTASATLKSPGMVSAHPSVTGPVSAQTIPERSAKWLSLTMNATKRRGPIHARIFSIKDAH